MTIKFSQNDKGSPAGKLADAELHFSGGPLDGLKLIGFGVWERRNGGRNVTFPARQYKLRDVVLDAYKEFEAELATAV